jgi:ketosteroid isomerase-like protein
VRRYFVLLAKEVEIQRYVPREFIAQGDRVVVIAGIQIAHKSLKRSESFDKIDVFKMRDGRLVEFHEYYDTAKAMAMYQPELSV